MPLPTNVGTGTVTGKFIFSDGTPAEGSITFTPSVSRLLNVTASPPVTIYVQPVTVELVAGAFTRQLIATDDVSNNPTGWTWTATLQLTGLKVPALTFAVPEGGTVDLTTVTPVARSGGVQIVRGAGLPEGGATGQVLIKNSDVDNDSDWGTATDIPALADALAAKNARVYTKRTLTASTTLVAADAFDTILHSTAGSAITITLPDDAGAVISQEVAIPWRQYGAGQITFAAGAGATLVSRASAVKSAGQYAEGFVTKTGANTWTLSGDITA